MDMLKGFAIFMVIAGHTIQYLISGDYCDKSAYRVIYSFHMPLFMAISGFFSYTNSIGGGGKTPIYQRITRRAWALLIPVVVFAFIMRYVLMESSRFLNPLIHSLWFLKSAFSCFALYSLATAFPVRNRIIPLMLTLLISQIFSIYNIRLMYPCFLAGAFLKSRITIVLQHIGTLTIISGAIWLAMVSFFDASFWKIRTQDIFVFVPIQLLLSTDCWYIMFYRLTVGLSGSLMFFGIFEMLSSRRFHTTLIGKYINAIGQETLWIYVLQTIILETYLPRYINFDSASAILFYSVIVPIISIGVLTFCIAIIRALKWSIDEIRQRYQIA